MPELYPGQGRPADAAVRARLVMAERKPADKAVFHVIDALEHFSDETAKRVIAEVRRRRSAAAARAEEGA